MPTHKLRLTNIEDQENRTLLSQLEKMGIPIEAAADASPEPERLTLKQTQNDFAGIYELPMGEVGVVVPAEMTVLKSGMLITDVAVRIPGDDCPIDLWDPEEVSHFHKELIRVLYHFPPRLLNPYLKPELPLNVCRVEGVIIAQGSSSFFSKYHDHSPVMVQLLLKDERANELCFDFGVAVDRSVTHDRERRRRQYPAFDPADRTGLYVMIRRQPRNQKSV